MKRRKWIKVHESWWTTPNHAGVKSDTLGFGIHLMMLADADPNWRETGSARLVDGRGRPLSANKLATIARVHAEKCRRMLGELVECGTLDLCNKSKCYSFPNYRDYQEDSSARRKRKGRDIHVKVPVNVTGEEEGEEEGEGEVDLKAPQPPAGVVPPAKKRASRKKPKGSYGVDPASVEDTDMVLGWIAKARKWCGFKASALTATHANRCYVAVPMAICEASIDDWKTVIGRAAAKDKDNPEMGRRYLTLSTLHRPDNFTRLMERDDLD